MSDSVRASWVVVVSWVCLGVSHKADEVSEAWCHRHQGGGVEDSSLAVGNRELLNGKTEAHPRKYKPGLLTHVRSFGDT